MTLLRFQGSTNVGSEDLRMVDPISLRNQLVDSWNMEGRFDATTISQY